MVDVFHSHVRRAATDFEVESVELPFRVSLHDPDTGEVMEEELVGSLDVVVNHGDRRVILKHKTAARKWSDDQVAFDFQLTAYRLAAREVGMGDVGFRLQVITKVKVPTVQIAELTRGPEDEVDLLRTVKGVLRAVDGGAFWPNRGWQCRGCPYQAGCR